MKTRLIILHLICAFLIQTAYAEPPKMSNQEYIDAYKDIAMREMRVHKIPASITLAQGLLESGSGNSRLAVQGNNHFGIKCKKNWTGRTIIEDDDEIGECFRAYGSALESFEDHSLFLMENRRYAFLFDLPILDYKAWAEGLKQAGYATNQRYPQLLIGLIERLNLAHFDTLVFYNREDTPIAVKNPTKPKVEITDNGVPMTVASAGQTVHSIAEENNMRDWQIYKYNDLPKGSRIEPGMVVYLKPKRNKAAVSTHVVEQGESMWEISQKYGIKLKKLYKKNRMEPGTEVKPGETINMRRKSKTSPETTSTVSVKIAETKTETDFQTKVVEQKPKEEIKVDVVKPATTNNSVSLNKNALYYEVKSGETLYSISRTLQLEKDSIVKWNRMINENIYVGQKLIYYTDFVKTAETPKAEFVEHFVSAGETMYSISRKYNVTVEEIQQWNNLNSNDLSIGQKLLIKSAQ